MIDPVNEHGPDHQTPPDDHGAVPDGQEAPGSSGDSGASGAAEIVCAHLSARLMGTGVSSAPSSEESTDPSAGHAPELGERVLEALSRLEAVLGAMGAESEGAGLDLLATIIELSRAPGPGGVADEDPARSTIAGALDAARDLARSIDAGESLPYIPRSMLDRFRAESGLPEAGSVRGVAPAQPGPAVVSAADEPADEPADALSDTTPDATDSDHESDLVPEPVSEAVPEPVQASVSEPIGEPESVLDPAAVAEPHQSEGMTARAEMESAETDHAENLSANGAVSEEDAVAGGEPVGVDRAAEDVGGHGASTDTTDSADIHVDHDDGVDAVDAGDSVEPVDAVDGDEQEKQIDGMESPTVEGSAEPEAEANASLDAADESDRSDESDDGDLGSGFLSELSAALSASGESLLSEPEMPETPEPSDVDELSAEAGSMAGSPALSAESGAGEGDVSDDTGDDAAVVDAGAASGVVSGAEEASSSVAESPDGPAMASDSAGDPERGAATENDADAEAERAADPDASSEGPDGADAGISSDGASAVPPAPTVLDPEAGVAVPPAPEVLDPAAGGAVSPAPAVLDPAGAAGVPPPPTMIMPGMDPTAPAPIGPGEPMALETVDENPDDEWLSRPLSVDPSKAELLQFLIADIRAANERIDGAAQEARGVATRDSAAETLYEVVEALRKTTEFFEFESLLKLADGLETIATAIDFVPESNISELLVRLLGISNLIEQLCCAFEVGMEMIWPLRTMLERVELLVQGERLHPDLIGWHDDDAERLLELDGVTEGVLNPPRPATSHDPGEAEAGASPAPSSAEPSPGASLPGPVSTPAKGPVSTPARASSSSSGAGAGGADAQSSVIRVESAQLEQIVDQVGHLVLCKNQLRQLTSRMDQQVEVGLRESMQSLAEEITMVTTTLQQAVMATRRQPMDRLFKGFVRAVRDAARISDKEVALHTVGEDTLADRELLDALTEPLITLLRICVSLSVETTQARMDRGVDAEANVTIEARSQGTHLEIRVHDDGRGIDRERVAGFAAEAGLLAPVAEGEPGPEVPELVGMMFDEAYPEAGLRNVASMIEELGGRIDHAGCSESGLDFTITVPLNSAILPAMLIESDRALYAVPLQQIIEIVRYEPDLSNTVAGSEVIRIRGEVYPLVRLHALFGAEGPDKTKHAMVVSSGDERYAIGVDRIVGQSEIVLRPMEASLGDGPFCGLTIRDDSGLSLVLDLSRIAIEASSLKTGYARASGDQDAGGDPGAEAGPDAQPVGVGAGADARADDLFDTETGTLGDPPEPVHD